MSTRGFEFAYMLDGSNATPLIRDFKLNAAAAHKVGDLVTIGTAGDMIQQTVGTTEVTGVMQEPFAATEVTAGTTLGRVAVLMREQVWRCSMDATTTSLIVGYSKTLDILDCNTLDADGTIGSICLVDASELDDEGNVLAYVVFSDTTFGNA